MIVSAPLLHGQIIQEKLNPPATSVPLAAPVLDLERIDKVNAPMHPALIHILLRRWAYSLLVISLQIPLPNLLYTVGY